MPKYLSLLFRFGLAGILLAACSAVLAPIYPMGTMSATPQPVTVVASLTPFLPSTETFTPPPTFTFTPETPTETPTSLPPSLTPRPTVKRVLIISIDGLRPDAIALAPMPNLTALMDSGAYTLVAQTIFPSVTLPAHASMLTSLCPAQHGVNWNDYIPENGYAKGTSIFALARQAGLYPTIMIVGKKKLRQITPPDTTDYFQFVNDRDSVVIQQAIPILKNGFALAFIHLATTDDMGHNYGWLSAQQLNVIYHADEAIKTLLTALEEAGLRQDTLIIVTADHGGHEQTHGSRLPEDMTIPWIISGPGVIPQKITAPVSTTDTAATAAWALHLSPPSDWIGRPVTEIFGLPAAIRAEPRCP